jgi:LacI family transcriptional regulator
MPSFRARTAAEQVADHLRRQLSRGEWTGIMPGGARLARELGVGRMTIEAALAQLEKEGLLEPQGERRRRRILLPDRRPTLRSLRLGLLFYEKRDRSIHYLIDLQHQLRAAGHVLEVAPRTLTELDMDPARVARMVGGVTADAWIVVAGSLEILEWFAARPTPTFALFGRQREFHLASLGVDSLPAARVAIQRLIDFGHRRIVQMARRDRRLPKPGQSEQAFLDQLAENGIRVGPYHLPPWEDTGRGFHERLEEMFRHTPPTALILQEAPLFFAAQQALLKLGLRVPDDVSLLCTDGDPYFEWFRPTVSHIRWDPRTLVRRIVRWAVNVSRGIEDRRRTLVSGEFVEGGTIGPVRPSG